MRAFYDHPTKESSIRWANLGLSTGVLQSITSGAKIYLEGSELVARSLNAVTRGIKYSARREIRIRDPNFRRYPARRYEDRRRKISRRLLGGMEKQGCVMYDLSALHADAARKPRGTRAFPPPTSSATFITHFRSHRATFKILRHLRRLSSVPFVPQNSFCRFQ